MIDKKNKLWKWYQPTKKDKDKYRKLTGLELKEIGIMTNKLWDMYLKLL